ncbi:MAG: hypothetical protein SGJ20_22755 [Planctomycetota bacterium]|nr:hypothetical protein [Planctomycetota bacterium]
MRFKLIAMGIAALFSSSGAVYAQEMLSAHGALPDVLPVSVAVLSSDAMGTDSLATGAATSCGCAADAGCCADSGCADCCCNDCGCAAPWQLSAGALFMARDYNNAPITIYQVSGQTDLSLTDLKDEYGWGFEIAGRRNRWEVR